MKNKLQDLRDHLFETIEALKDEDNPMDLKRAETIKNVAQTVINTGKLEVDFMRETGLTPTRFIESRGIGADRSQPPRLVKSR